MKYSIVMPCLYNNYEKLEIIKDTVDSVITKSKDYEFIIVDDGSPFPTGFLRGQADTYIMHKEPEGIAPSWNDGKNVSRGEYVVIINDDIRVPEMWLQIMAKRFRDPKVGVVGVSLAGPNVVPQITEDNPGYDHKWFSGYCFMLKRDRFFEDFDEDFVPFNFEDIDYWERIQGSGLELIKAPIGIYHAEGATIHSMRYEETDNENLRKFINKWGFNPKSKYFG